MPAAVQRSAISPELHLLTPRWVRRTISIIDSQGFVEQAAALPDEIGAVVSRGGRPDLAEPHLADVRAPTFWSLAVAIRRCSA